MEARLAGQPATPTSQPASLPLSAGQPASLAGCQAVRLAERQAGWQSERPAGRLKG